MGANYIKEKDVTTAKLLDRLDLNGLQSVEALTKDRVCYYQYFDLILIY